MIRFRSTWTGFTIALATAIVAGAFLARSFAAEAEHAATSKLVSIARDGKLQYTPAANGDVIPDFSNCGYMGGGVKLPDVPVKVTLHAIADSKDDTARIQQAIEQVAKMPADKNGIRGAVLLSRGKYRIVGQLKITASGVILRGEGDGEDGTILIGASHKQHEIIAIKGAVGRREQENTRQKITTAYVPVGGKTFDVADASAFKVGDTVLVHRVGNADWIHFIAMDRIAPRPGNPGSTKQWQPFELHFDRVITKIDPSTSSGQAGRITIDAPITCAIDAKWGGGAISKFADERIEQVGVENLRGDSEFDAKVTKEDGGKPYAADEAHELYLVSFDNVKNSWARNLTAAHFYHGVEITRDQAKWITVQDCSTIDPVSEITGGRRYPFCTTGQLILVQRCHSRDGRHAFVVQARVCGPNVFLDCASEKDHATSEPHHRWSVGGLYDNVHAHMALQDRQYMGSGHGWAGANYVMWNCEGTLVCQQPPTAQNYAIGFVGEKTKGAFDRPDGYWESLGKHVEPKSLYLKQLEDRLGKQSVANVSVSEVEGSRVARYDNGGEEKAGMRIENAQLRVKLLDNNRVRIEAKKGGMALVAKLFTDGMQASSGVHKDSIGEAQALTFQAKDGSSQQLWLYPDSPFVCTSVAVKNPGTTPLTLSTVTPLSGEFESTKPISEMRLFSSDGVSPVQSKGSYLFMTVVDPQSSAGMVGGWLTHERSSGVVTADVKSSALSYNARAEYGKVTIAPGDTEQGEVFALGFFDDAHDGLESFADTIAKVNQIKLPPPYNGYSTWYHAKATGTSGASDAPHMERLAKFAKENRLTDFGLNFLQIDDQWQIARRDFTTHKTGDKAPYPEGMKKTAETIKANGMFAGIWLTPFGWQGREFQDDKPNENKTALKDHPDWFVKRADGSVYWVRWAGDCLDMSHPEARKFLAETIARLTHDWGYKLLKIDGLWAGMAVKILYPDPKYRDDEFGDAVFYDKTKTNEQVYRDGLRLVREAGGKDVFLLGCNIAQNMRTLGGSIGLVDSMRIGPDIKAEWPAIVRCAKPAGWLYFLNGKVWWNDPDCIMVREPLTIASARAWASFVAISGQLNLVSEFLPDLPSERLEIYKRTLPNSGHSGRPVDLFEREMPRIWHLTWGDGEDRRDVVALFNWTAPTTQPTGKSSGMEEPTDDKSGTKVAAEGSKIVLDLKRLGLSSNQKYVGFDYWENAFVPEFSGDRTFDVAPGSCRVIALRPVSDHPQVIGTSRHVTQGAVDLVSVKWDAAAKSLVGRSKVVAGDDYEIRIDPAQMELKSASVVDNKASAESKMDGKFVRVMLHPQQSGEVSWACSFAGDQR